MCILATGRCTLKFGIDLYPRVYYLGMDPERSVDCIKLFGHEVIPHFSESR